MAGRGWPLELPASWLALACLPRAMGGRRFTQKHPSENGLVISVPDLRLPIVPWLFPNARSGPYQAAPPAAAAISAVGPGSSAVAAAASVISGPGGGGGGGGPVSPQHHELTSLFECPVCFDYVLPPILQCQAGHLVCNQCRQKLSCCPTCRGSLTPSIRNLAMEKVASAVLFPCKYATMGCSLTDHHMEELEYEDIAEYYHPPGSNG